MGDLHNVRISTDKNGGVRVGLDDMNVKGVVRYSVHHDAGGRPEVTLTIVGNSLNNGLPVGTTWEDPAHLTTKEQT